jgi:hypothetical protein
VLMDELSWILAGKGFVLLDKQAGARKGGLNFGSAVNARIDKGPSMRYVYSDKEKAAAILLALRTLATFNIEASLPIIEFVKESVVGYLDDDDPCVSIILQYYEMPVLENNLITKRPTTDKRNNFV